MASRLAVLLAAAVMLCGVGLGQATAQQTDYKSLEYRPPRTSEGRVDFQGVWTQRWITPLERPPEAKALVVEPKDVGSLEKALLNRLTSNDPLQDPTDYDPLKLLKVRGEFRSSLIVSPADGLLPYTAEGKARRAAWLPNARRGADDPEQRGDNERCLGFATGYAPHMSAPVANIRQVVQTKD